MLFPGFIPFNIHVFPNITIYGVKGGSGPPLLLLHGFPQNHLIWHLVAPRLSQSYTVIALDLRGYGGSSYPPGEPDHGNYSKSTMAADCITVMNAFGFPQFYVCAHDRGARVTHSLLVNYLKSVLKAILLDICPTLAMYSQTDFAFASAYAHWFFLIKQSTYPET